MLSRKAAASEEARRTLRYVEPLSDARTPLAAFFSILPGFIGGGQQNRSPQSHYLSNPAIGRAGGRPAQPARSHPE